MKPEGDLDQIALIKRNTKFFTPPLHWNKIIKYEKNIDTHTCILKQS